MRDLAQGSGQGWLPSPHRNLRSSRLALLLPHRGGRAVTATRCHIYVSAFMSLPLVPQWGREA